MIKSKVKYVAACPRWVESYGVIPHTYMRYVLFFSTAFTLCEDVSESRSAGSSPPMAKAGISTEDQEFISVSYCFLRKPATEQRANWDLVAGMHLRRLSEIRGVVSRRSLLESAAVQAKLLTLHLKVFQLFAGSLSLVC